MSAPGEQKAPTEETGQFLKKKTKKHLGVKVVKYADREQLTGIM